MALPILAAGASLLGGLFASSSASKAARAQTQTANRQMDMADRYRGEDIQRFQPYYTAGTNALQAYMSEMGMGAAPQGYGGYEASPLAQYMLTQGRDQIEAGAAARGGLFSGNTAQGLDQMRMGVIGQDRDNFLARLLGLTQQGQAAAGQTAGVSGQWGGMQQTALANYGNAASASAMATSNAWQTAMDNALKTYSYLRDA